MILEEQRIEKLGLGNYGAGIAEEEGSEVKKRSKTNKACKCGSFTHQRTSYKHCILNKSNTTNGGNKMDVEKKDDRVYRVNESGHRCDLILTKTNQQLTSSENLDNEKNESLINHETYVGHSYKATGLKSNTDENAYKIIEEGDSMLRNICTNTNTEDRASNIVDL